MLDCEVEWVGTGDVGCFVIFIAIDDIFVSLQKVLVCDIHTKTEHLLCASCVHSYLLTSLEDIHCIQLHNHSSVMLWEEVITSKDRGQGPESLSHYGRCLVDGQTRWYSANDEVLIENLLDYLVLLTGAWGAHLCQIFNRDKPINLAGGRLCSLIRIVCWLIWPENKLDKLRRAYQAFCKRLGCHR